MTEKEPITVAVDEDIIDLVPGYLENRRRDLEEAHKALEARDFETLRVIGHQMKGSGGGYGMDRLTEVGQGLEEASKASDVEGVRDGVERLEDYLERVRVVPE